MKVILRRPAFWFLIKILFPSAKWGEVILTFGNNIYAKEYPRKDLIKHEEVHGKQQKHSFVIATVWWIRYSFSKKFRLSQEIPAHIAQYKALGKQHRSYVANCLASDVYGNMISNQEAYKLLK